MRIQGEMGGPQGIDISQVSEAHEADEAAKAKAALTNAEQKTELEEREDASPVMQNRRLTRIERKDTTVKGVAKGSETVLIRVDDKESDEAFKKFKDENPYLRNIPSREFKELLKGIIDAIKPDAKPENIIHYIETSLGVDAGRVDKIVVVKAFEFIINHFDEKRHTPGMSDGNKLVLENKVIQLKEALTEYLKKPEVKEAQKIAEAEYLKLSSRVTDMVERSLYSKLAEELIGEIKNIIQDSSKDIRPGKELRLSTAIWQHVEKRVTDSKASTVVKQLSYNLEMLDKQIDDIKTTPEEKTALKHLGSKIDAAKTSFENVKKAELKVESDLQGTQKTILDQLRKEIFGTPKTVFDEFREINADPNWDKKYGSMHANLWHFIGKELKNPELSLETAKMNALIVAEKRAQGVDACIKKVKALIPAAEGNLVRNHTLESAAA